VGFLWTDSRFAAGHLDDATHISINFFSYFFQTEVDLPEKQYLTTGRDFSFSDYFSSEQKRKRFSK
jgi:hypothetical protein